MFKRLKKSKLFKLMLEPLENRTVPVAGVLFVPANPATITTGINPDCIDTGDVNDDGRLDVVVANFSSSNVSVFLGNGDGTYQTPLTFPVSANPSSLIVTDLNDDCKLDIVTSSFSANNICSLLNTGLNGANTVSFGAPILSPAGNGIKAIAPYDFNGDGSTDLVSANSGSNNISLIISNKDGTFGNERTFAVGTTPVALAVGDVNKDGSADVVVANSGSNNISVLLKSEDPGCIFERQAIYDVGTNPSSLALGDINGDAVLDVVVTNRGSDNVSLLLGNGNGTFKAQTTLSVGKSPASVAMGDLNGDAFLDFVVANSGSDNISIFLGNGNGTFAPQINYNSQFGPAFVKLANVNGPNAFMADILIADLTSNDVRILLNTQTSGSSSGGSTTTPISVPGSGGSGGPTSRINLSTTFAVGPGSSPNSYSTPTVKVYNSASTSPSTPIATITAYSTEFTGGVVTAMGDVNHDGYIDLIVGAGEGGGPHIKVYSGTDFSTLLYNFFAFDPSFLGGVTVASADINGDYYDDIIVGAGVGGGPRVIAFSGQNLNVLQDFFAFESDFTGGTRIATGLINSDGIYDIVVGAGAGGGPRVKTFDGSNLNVINDFFAFETSFTGGVYVSAGNVGGGSVDKIVVGAGSGGAPFVRLFDQNGAMLQSFLAYASTFTGGVRVATGLTSSTSTSADIITGPGIGATPNVRSYNSQGQLAQLNFFAFSQAFSGGIFVGGRGF